LAAKISVRRVPFFVVPAQAAVIKSVALSNRRPRESGGPELAPGMNRGQATEIPGFPRFRGNDEREICGAPADFLDNRASGDPEPAPLLSPGAGSGMNRGASALTSVRRKDRAIADYDA